MTPEQAYDITIKNDGKINKKLEPFIIKDPYYAYAYAENVMRSRWIEAEDIIATNSWCAYMYALKVTKGKLPENMHNAMILHALQTDNHAKLYHAKLYFNFINP